MPRIDIWPIYTLSTQNSGALSCEMRGYTSICKREKEKIISYFNQGCLCLVLFRFSVSGAPIIRPIWWVSPNDEHALMIDSEFLVGDTLLVAPVLEKGATKRDIYLPEGDWHDEINDQHESGKQWIRDYKVELSKVAYFTAARILG